MRKTVIILFVFVFFIALKMGINYWENPHNALNQFIGNGSRHLFLEQLYYKMGLAAEKTAFIGEKIAYALDEGRPEELKGHHRIHIGDLRTAQIAFGEMVGNTKEIANSLNRIDEKLGLYLKSRGIEVPETKVLTCDKHLDELADPRRH